MPYTNPYVPNLDPLFDKMKQKGDINWGGIAQAGIAAGGLALNTVNMANQRLDIDEKAPGIETSATGEPVYNSSFYLQAKNAKPQGASAGEVLSGASSGLGAGLGTAMALGAAAGPFALAGLAVGVGASLIGGNQRRKAQARQKRRAMASAKAQQKSFNVASEAFDEQQASQQDYIRRRNMTNRLYNLYQV